MLHERGQELDSGSRCDGSDTWSSYSTHLVECPIAQGLLASAHQSQSLLTTELMAHVCRRNNVVTVVTSESLALLHSWTSAVPHDKVRVKAQSSINDDFVLARRNDGREPAGFPRVHQEEDSVMRGYQGLELSDRRFCLDGRGGWDGMTWHGDEERMGSGVLSWMSFHCRHRTTANSQLLGRSF